MFAAEADCRPAELGVWRPIGKGGSGRKCSAMFKRVAIEREVRPVPARGEEASQSGGLLLTLAAPIRWRPSRLPPQGGWETSWKTLGGERAQVMTRSAPHVESGDVISGTRGGEKSNTRGRPRRRQIIWSWFKIYIVAPRPGRLSPLGNGLWLWQL